MHPFLEGLFRQHRDAEAMLADLGKAIASVRGGAGSQPDVVAELRRLRREIQGEVLSHFREEELALFPVLGRHVEVSGGPIAMLMEEHARFRQLELEFEEALAAMEASLGGVWHETLCAAADEIRQMMPAHIEKEDDVLFPMAESMLEESEWADVERLWSAAVEAAREDL